MEVLENTFLSPFHDEIDAAKLYNIVSGQPVDDSIKENLLSLESAGKQLMSKYIERMSTETYSERIIMASNFSLKVNGMRRLLKSDCREIYLVNFFNLLIETMHKM